MLGASRTAMAEVTRRLDEVLESGDASALGAELFQVVRLLDREYSLRRVLADSSAAPERRTALAGELLESQVSPATILVVNEVVGATWSRPRDMTDAVETLAVFATVDMAQRSGQVDELEDEIFRFGRIVAARPELRAALTRPGAAEEHLRTLVSDLIGDKVNAASARLITEVVVDPRGHTLEQGLEIYGALVADRVTRYIAVVRTAVPLGAEQQERLRGILSRRYGRTIHLNIEIAPEIVGGMSIRVGDEVMNGTIAGRVAEVRRRLGG